MRASTSIFPFIPCISKGSIRIWRTVRLGFRQADGSWNIIWTFLRIFFKSAPFSPAMSVPPI